MKGILLSALALMCLLSPARAAELDLEGWLDEPGTKLVAVEFYADWCKPCVESAPRWEALRKKYAAQGLKLVVVNLTETDERPGKCTGLPWNPDESLCDPKLGEQLGVKSLPEAFRKEFWTPSELDSRHSRGRFWRARALHLKLSGGDFRTLSGPYFSSVEQGETMQKQINEHADRQNSQTKPVPTMSRNTYLKL